LKTVQLPKGMRVAPIQMEGTMPHEKNGKLNFKVSEKGAVSVYGLGRFPVTLYYEQWVRLLASAEELRDFVEANKSNLKLKDAE
jgi:hypothetical protein